MHSQLNRMRKNPDTAAQWVSRARPRACARAARRPHGSGPAILWYAEHNLTIFGQLRPGEFKGGYATTYGGCLAAPIGVLCLVVYRVDLLRRSV